MPENNNLKPTKFPMELRFGEKPETEFKNNLRNIKITLKNYPSMNDLRDYIVNLLERTENEKTQMIPNLREFIFSKMMDLSPNVFVELIKNILIKEFGEADEMMKDNNIIKNAISDVNYEEPTTYKEPTYQEEPEGDGDTIEGKKGNELIDFFNKPKEPVVQEKPEEKKKKWFEYSRGELNNFLNKAIDEQDWTVAREIQAAIERKDQNNK